MCVKHPVGIIYEHEGVSGYATVFGWKAHCEMCRDWWYASSLDPDTGLDEILAAIKTHQDTGHWPVPEPNINAF